MDVLRYFTWNPYMTNSRVTSNVAAGQGDGPGQRSRPEAGESRGCPGRFGGARCLVGGGLGRRAFPRVVPGVPGVIWNSGFGTDPVGGGLRPPQCESAGVITRRVARGNLTPGLPQNGA